jgi:DNA-binding beta-propeller fold protein YncE
MPVRTLSRVLRSFLALVLLALAAAGCGSSDPSGPGAQHGSGTASATSPGRLLNVYSADRPGNLSSVVRGDAALVYVPNTLSNTMTVISQRTFRVLATVQTGAVPQHVTPSWDLRTLYIDNNAANTLTPVNPRTGIVGTPIPVEDPYNLYFTPDGRYAIVVAEAMQRLDFRHPKTMALAHSLSVPMCAGVDHADFSADGRYMYLSCEFSGKMIEVDLRTQRVVGTLTIANGHSSPQDVKLSPDGQTLYTADQAAGGVWEIDPYRFKLIGFLRTGAGAHGLYPSRDATRMYVSNRSVGSVSVVSFKTRQVVATWQIPRPASPDMGGVSVDGSTLWLSGRYNAEVYAIDTRTGRLRARIPVGQGPHGLCVWPQPGRYSLGHTGVMR